MPAMSSTRALNPPACSSRSVTRKACSMRAHGAADAFAGLLALGDNRIAAQRFPVLRVPNGRCPGFIYLGSAFPGLRLRAAQLAAWPLTTVRSLPGRVLDFIAWMPAATATVQALFAGAGMRYLSGSAGVLGSGLRVACSNSASRPQQLGGDLRLPLPPIRDRGVADVDHAQTLLARVRRLTKESAAELRPLDSGPVISEIAPSGKPPSSNSSNAAMPVGAKGRTIFGRGVSAEGMRSASEVSIWRRRAAADGIGEPFSLYLRLILNCCQSRFCLTYGATLSVIIESKWLIFPLPRLNADTPSESHGSHSADSDEYRRHPPAMRQNHCDHRQIRSLFAISIPKI